VKAEPSYFSKACRKFRAFNFIRDLMRSTNIPKYKIFIQTLVYLLLWTSQYLSVVHHAQLIDENEIQRKIKLRRWERNQRKLCSDLNCCRNIPFASFSRLSCFQHVHAFLDKTTVYGLHSDFRFHQGILI